MSYPFGGHPTFAHYLAWAESQSCSVISGVSFAGGQTFKMTKVISPKGGYFVDVGTLDGEYLAPTTVGRWDRRLGLKSPFPSMP